MRFQAAICIALFLVIDLTPEVEAACCYKCDRYRCNDCTAGTPNCGYGPCNLFGCACKGGCRRGPGCRNCKKRSVFEVDEETSALQSEQSQKESDEHLEAIFKLADKDGDGKLDVSEAKFWASQNGFNHTSRRVARSIDNEFLRLDVDNDGLLSRWEIDH